MSRHRAVIIITLALTAVAGLSGCAASTSDISVRTSELMESMVVSTADQLAAGDTAGAATTLDALQSQLDRALSAGDVSGDRATRIQEAIDLVRSDLQPAPEVTPAPTETPEPSESVAPDAPTVTETPVTDSGPGNNGNGKTDKGGNGKGGNGKGAGNNK